MITYIKGEVLNIAVQDNFTIVEVLTASGLGYSVFVPTDMGLLLGEEVEFYTSFQVREDSQSLYGFKSKESKSVFDKFIGISGIGPKIAIAVLSTYSLDEISEILEQADFKRLSKVSGLGDKGSKKVILELQGKLELGDGSDSGGNNSLVTELRGALESLGFQGKDLDQMVDKGKVFVGDGVEMIEDLVQKVLQN